MRRRARRPMVLMVSVALALAMPDVAQELEADADTLFLLHANGDLVGASGETPVSSSGVSFEPGVHGPGLRIEGTDGLYYAAAGELDPAHGTIEMWLKPSWSGSDGTTRTFFALGSDLWLEKDGADNLVFIILLPDSEAHRSYSLRGVWEADEWHHVAATWEIPGSMRIYVDGFERVAFPSSEQDLMTWIPPTFSLGSKGIFNPVEAVLDEVRISARARTPAEIADSFLRGLDVSAMDIVAVTHRMYPTWRQTAHLSVFTDGGPVDVPADAALWESSAPSTASVDAGGRITALGPGPFELTATIGALAARATFDVLAPLLPVERGAVDPALAVPMPGSLHEVPVVIVRYFPTEDGLNHDVSWDPDFWWLNPVSLAALDARIDAYDRYVKFALEEGSRFRGYQDPSARPSLGYRVVDSITVYEPTPPGKRLSDVGGQAIWLPDFPGIFERLGIQRLVEQEGVQEIWFWSGGVDPGFPSYDPGLHTPDRFRGNWESNMSSPTSGDVSNSDRDASDLPVYARTYVLYGQNLRRTQAEAVHNHGHQLESILAHVNQLRDGNTELFWQRFVGRAPDFAWVPGRCGDTHHPPNAEADYDYGNLRLVMSDIADWNPQGTGVRLRVNADTWGGIPYNWPGGPPAEQRVESQWYLYWMQSMPGHENGIRHGADVLSNWWKFTADWDGSLASGLGLHAPPSEPLEDALVPTDHATIADALRRAEDRNGDGWIVVRVLAGTYAESPRIRRSHLRLVGSGPDTILRGNRREDVLRAAPREGQPPLEEVHVSGFTITGGGGGDGLELSRVHSGGISDCTVTDCREGVLVQDSRHITLSGLDVHDNRSTGVRISRTSGISIAASRARGNLGRGVYFQDVGSEPGFGSACTDVEAAANRDDGVLVVRSEDLVVRGCRLLGNARSGVRLADTHGLLLEGNLARANRADGLRLERTNATLVTRNTFADNLGFGIRSRETIESDFSSDPGLQPPVGDNEASGNRLADVDP